jgi:hypothetical protein
MGTVESLINRRHRSLTTRTTSGHQKVEERSIALHRRISEMLKGDPELLAMARHNLQKGMEIHGNLRVFQEWNRILDRPVDEIRAILVSPSQKARWLRQSSPFSGILDPRERWKIYEAFST